LASVCWGNIEYPDNRNLHSAPLLFIPLPLLSLSRDFNILARYSIGF
jgi:hypothetical protein